VESRPPISPESFSRPKFADERAELDSVLSSEIFRRAPSLAKLLTYICEKVFSGQEAEIKEYNIAVEALGRPADFDQKRDSIVRVEAHRLRKRLREYYETEGKDHTLRIELPVGAYVPVFVSRNGEAQQDWSQSGSNAPPAEEAKPEPGPPPVAPASRRARIAAVAGVAVLGLAVVSLVWVGRSLRQAPAPAPVPPQQPVDLSATATVGEIRIAAGSASAVRDRDGQLWLSDRYFQGGRAVTNPKLDPASTLTPELFRSWREVQFAYHIPLKAGTYELTLWFCEPVLRSGSGNSRTFRITLNGRVLVEEMDPITEAGGGQIVTARTWRDIQPGPGGLLHLEFSPLAGPAVLSALSIVPGTPGRLRPIRIAAREEPYTDSAGRVWLSDRFFFGGKLVKRIEPIQGTEDPELYRGERYGRLTYTIPAPPDSTYTAVFHFAETWFGSRQGGGGEGSRLFDILCNGILLEQNLDVYRAAGGPFRAIRRTYRGLKPSPNGKLAFQLVPGRNYAFLNALEILDEGRAPAGPRAEK